MKPLRGLRPRRRARLHCAGVGRCPPPRAAAALRRRVRSPRRGVTSVNWSEGGVYRCKREGLQM